MYRHFAVIINFYSISILNISAQSWYSASVTEQYYAINNKNNSIFGSNSFISEQENKYSSAVLDEISNENTWSRTINSSLNGLYPTLEHKGLSDHLKTPIDKLNPTKKLEQNIRHNNENSNKRIKNATNQHISITNNDPIKNITINKTIYNSNIIRTRPKKIIRCPTVRPRVRNQKRLDPKSKSNLRFLDVFQIVEFEHVSCTSSSGLEGKCLHEYECKKSGGSTMGDCADGYGTCCVGK